MKTLLVVYVMNCGFLNCAPQILYSVPTASEEDCREAADGLNKDRADRQEAMCVPAAAVMASPR